MEFQEHHADQLNKACDFIIRMEPVIKAVADHGQKIHQLELSDAQKTLQIGNHAVDIDSTNEKIEEVNVKLNDFQLAEAKGDTAIYWRVIGILLPLALLGLQYKFIMAKVVGE